MSRPAKAHTPNNKNSYDSWGDIIALLPEELQEIENLVKKREVYHLDKDVAGEFIRKYRESITPTISVRKMARIMGMSHTHYSELERGIKTWSVEHLVSAYDCLTAFKNVVQSKEKVKIDL